MVADVVERSEVAAWAIGLEAGGAASAISLLTDRDQVNLTPVTVDDGREPGGCQCRDGSPAPAVEDGLVHRAEAP